ncbi:AlpA family phage regulatory protein [Paraburkholderia aspalathi]|nr:AlpA family phage regulatory protein [Paraburkholderia aspalathi]
MSTDSAAPTRTIASTTYSTNIPLLDQVIGWARSRARDRYIKEQEVVATIGRSKAAMRRDVSLGLFPAPVKTGIKSTRWRESEVMAWVEATTILSRVANPGFSMEEFVAALMTSRVPM